MHRRRENSDIASSKSAGVDKTACSLSSRVYSERSVSILSRRAKTATCTSVTVETVSSVWIEHFAIGMYLCSETGTNARLERSVRRISVCEAHVLILAMLLIIPEASLSVILTARMQRILSGFIVKATVQFIHASHN